MSDPGLCKAKGCKARIVNGGSHDLCPHHSACNVNDKYNPDAYICSHCLPWLLVLRSSSPSEKEKVSAVNKLRLWANQFRRLRLEKRLLGEWVAEASLKKLIYRYSTNPPSSAKNRAVTLGKKEGSNSSDDELKLQVPVYDSQKFALSPPSSPLPKRTRRSESRTLQKGPTLQKDKVNQKGKFTKGINDLQNEKSLQKRKNTESVCNTANQGNHYKRMCHEGSKSLSPSVSSDCASSPKDDLSFFTPDNPVNAMWDFSLQFDLLKAEIKEMHKGIDDMVSSQKSLGDSLKEKIEIGFKGIEDKFTKKFELLTKATNSVPDSERLKPATQGDESLSLENCNVNRQVETSLTPNTANDPSSNLKDASASSEQDLNNDGEAARPSALRDNCLSVNVPEGSLSFLSKLFQTSEIWETFFKTKKVEWLQDTPVLNVNFEDQLLSDIQKSLCAPALPNDVGTRQLKAGLPFLTPDLLNRDKIARQRLHDILVAVAVQEQLVQQLEEITRAEFKDSVPASFLGNFEAHKLAIYSLISPLRDAITEFFTTRLALRNKVFTKVGNNIRIQNLKCSSPFCPELFPESLVSSIHHSLRIANLDPFAVFKEKQKLQSKCKRTLRKRTS